MTLSRDNIHYSPVPDTDSANEKDPAITKRNAKSNKKIDKYKEKMKKRENDNIIKWFWRAPLSRWGFIYFLIAAVASVGIVAYYIISSFIAYIIGGANGLITAAYGTFHFRQLIALRKEVDKMSELNLNFRQENMLLEKEIDNLAEVNRDLNATQEKISASVAKNSLLSQEFGALSDHMLSLNAKSIAQVLNLSRKAHVVREKWMEELMNEERLVLLAIFDHFEMGDGDAGMSLEEFEEFVNSIPSIYRQRFMKLGSFLDISEGRDVIMFSDFQKVLDIFVETQIDDDFRAVRDKKTERGDDGDAENDEAKYKEVADERYGMIMDLNVDDEKQDISTMLMMVEGKLSNYESGAVGSNESIDFDDDSTSSYDEEFEKGKIDDDEMARVLLEMQAKQKYRLEQRKK